MDSPAVAAPAPPPVGRYGPLVHLSRFDEAAEELSWQLPLNGELYRLLPGPDRPDYSLMVLRRPLHFYPPEGFDLERVEAAQRVPDRKGRPMVRVHALVVCARFVGEQLRPRMSDLPVHVAYVIDNSLAREERLDLAKVEYAGSGFLSEGHVDRRPSTVPAPVPISDEEAAQAEPVGGAPAGLAAVSPVEPETKPEPEQKSESPRGPEGEKEPAPGTDVAREAAMILRRGIEERLGRPVDRLTASFSLGDGHRVTGLRGNADGQAPEPTVETFARLNDVFARLGQDPATADVRGVRIHVGQGSEDIELARS
ncbi:hypothetical protein [Intrasporangium sp. DVR]|uniref:hypothetical protein n=1 Tax=Intrasporangium sp. DVR TaxID=3127867 RepID=UPI00313A6A91